MRTPRKKSKGILAIPSNAEGKRIALKLVPANRVQGNIAR